MTRQDVELHLDKFGMWNRKGNLRAAAIELEAAMRMLLDLVDPAGAKPVVVDPTELPVISGTLHLDLSKIAAENVEVVKKPRARKAKAAPKRRTRTKKAA
jgi:hypothetical protein